MKKCKACNRSAPDVRFERNRASCIACRKPLRAAYNRTTAAIRASWVATIKSKYAMTVEDFARLALAQDFCCAICGSSLDFAKLTHVDHDHSTGRVRGILCTHCNRGLGAFRDNPALLIKAVSYLDK
jgi:hypothetical protein